MIVFKNHFLSCFSIIIGSLVGWLSKEGQPFFFAFLAMVSLPLGLWFLLKQQDWKRLFFASAGYFFAQNSWMIALKNPPEFPFLAGFGFCLALFFSCWIASQIFLAAKVAFRGSGQGASITVFEVLLFICLVTLFEWHRQWFFSGYTFYTISSILLKHSYLTRCFSYVGVFGATFLFLAATLFPLFFPKKVISYMGALVFLGMGVIPSKINKQKTAKIALYQTNFDPWTNFEANPDPIDVQKSALIKMLDEIEGVDCLILSETSIPGRYFEGEIQESILAQSKQKNIDILVGHFTPLDEEKESFHNSVSLVHQGKVVGRYDKMRLVSFMESRWEFLPKSILEALETTNFIAGKKKNILTGKFRYGIHICYDDYFGADHHDFILEKADLIASLHNDVWIEDRTFKWNHFNQTILRAVEGGIPVVRGANGGFVGYALPSGVYTMEEPRGKLEEKLHIFDVDLDQLVTWYPVLQDRFVVIFALFWLIVCFLKRLLVRGEREEEIDEKAL